MRRGQFRRLGGEDAGGPPQAGQAPSPTATSADVAYSLRQALLYGEFTLPIVGAEESRGLARRLPMLDALPLPVAWSLRFGPPVHFYADLDPHSAEDPTLVSRLAAQVRQTLEDLLRTQRSARRSVIFG